MTYEMEYLLKLVGCGARGQIAPPPIETIDWEKLIEMAGCFKMKRFVLYAIKISCNLGCPEYVRQIARKEVIQQSLKYHYGTEVLSKLQLDLEKEGIPSALLKGYAVSRAYKVPELRMGCDIDLYVDLKDEKKALAWFENHHWKINVRRRNRETHDVLYKESVGLLELHVCLYGKNSPIYLQVAQCEEDIRTPKRPFLLLETTQGNLKTLQCNDHAIFLCIHMIKHLLAEQMTNPRQLLDVAVFIDHYRDQLDKALFWRVMECLKYRTLIGTTLRLAEKYFGYDYQDFLSFEVTMQQIESLETMYFKTGMTLSRGTGQVAQEYNLLTLHNKKQKYYYKFWVLMDYARAVKGKIKREGFIEMIRISIRRFNGIILHKYKQVDTDDLDNPSVTEEKLKFLRDMDML